MFFLGGSSTRVHLIFEKSFLWLKVQISTHVQILRAFSFYRLDIVGNGWELPRCLENLDSLLSCQGPRFNLQKSGESNCALLIRPMKASGKEKVYHIVVLEHM